MSFKKAYFAHDDCERIIRNFASLWQGPLQGFCLIPRCPLP
jgi:hypothetical protein